jgi:two-component system NtrC family sensor kinase
MSNTAPSEALSPTVLPTLMLVDDSPIVLRALTRMLRTEYAITTAANGREALDRLRAGDTFEVIVCDVAMPEMNGVAFYQKLLCDVPNLAGRFLFATGGAETMRSMGFLLDTRVRVLLKPFGAAALRSAIDAVRASASTSSGR